MTAQELSIPTGYSPLLVNLTLTSFKLGKAQSGTIKIGFVSPRTGPLAAFAQPDDFTLEQVRKATGGKVRVGGRTYNPITWKSYTRIPSPTPTAPPR